MSTADAEKVGRLESRLRDMVQVPIATTHHFHAGMYARTIRIPQGVVITGALIRIPTMLIVSGHVTVFIGGDSIELRGYHVIPASAGRKQVFVAHADTDLTMLFPTSAGTVEEAEAEFTDETELLMSRQQSGNLTITTGE
jgi:hypothetical protein